MRFQVLSLLERHAADWSEGEQVSKGGANVSSLPVPSRPSRARPSSTKENYNTATNTEHEHAVRVLVQYDYECRSSSNPQNPDKNTVSPRQRAWECYYEELFVMSKFLGYIMRACVCVRALSAVASSLLDAGLHPSPMYMTNRHIPCIYIDTREHILYEVLRIMRINSLASRSCARRAGRRTRTEDGESNTKYSV